MDNLILEQIDYMKHCIGYERKSVKRGKYKAYRNYFTTSNNDPIWDDIFKSGLAVKRSFPNGGGDNPQCYSLNDKGLKFLSDLLGCIITEAD